MPVPGVTSVPPWTIAGAVGDAASGATGAGRLATGSDSPVSGDSSTSSPRAPSSRASAGDALARPQLDDVAGHDALGVEHASAPPSRTTVARSGTSAASAWIARPARHSCTKPISAVGDHDGEHDGAVDDLAERERDGAGRDQHDDQRARELAQQHGERRLTAAAAGDVRTDGGQPRGCLVRAEAVGARADRIERGIRRLRMPRQRRLLGG